MRTRFPAVAAACAGVLLLASAARAAEVTEEAAAYFKTNCTSCHTIGGGPLAGPDLKDVTKRRTREQIAAFVRDPKAAIDAGDPYLTKLLSDMRGVYMPPQPTLTGDRLAQVLDLIEAESALPKSRFSGMAGGDRPLTPADRALGAKLFDGTVALQGGAPACVSCHDVEGSPGFGGGRLGPDLTDVIGRLGGRKALQAWLSSPQSPTMAPVFANRTFTDDEVLGLVAYLQDRAAQPGAALRAGGRNPAGAGIFEFLAAGVAGLLALLAAFDFLWRGRFRGVRRAMVEGARR